VTDPINSTTLPDSKPAPDGKDAGLASVQTLPTVAIIGRPNVGKSTFFNRIVGGRLAIVDSQPGVTRDVHLAEAEWAGRRFYVMDTGGIIEGAVDEVDEAVRHQALGAIEMADLLVFMVDGKEGVHPLDEHIAGLLRRKQAKVLLVVNKVDNLPDSTDHLEFYALGLGDPQPLSAVSGRGSGNMLDRIVELLPPETHGAPVDEGLRLAIIGRPNVGKSSFINKLLGTIRLVVSEEAGTTRDAIDTPFEKDGRRFVFVDTAGLRRKSRVPTGLEYYAMVRTLRAIDRADVCLLIADANQGISNQDFRIAKLAWDRGRGLVLAVNKWDLVEKDTHTASRMEKELRERVPFLSAVPIVFVSALTGQRVERALDLAWQVGEDRRKRVSTHEINNVLQSLIAAVQPPQRRGRPIKFYYATQVGSAPPVFAVFSNYPRDVPENYVRYLIKGFRQAWGFSGSPIRLKLKARRKERS
jgi:GTP-binding protein